jgi:two-component system OmpR family sensor kinase
MKLLSKTTLFYLVFTFLAFFLSALFLTQEAEEFIHDELQHRFSYSEKRVRRQLKAGKYPEKLPSNALLVKLEKKTDMQKNPVYSDTLVYNSELEEMQLLRKKTIVFEEQGNTYKLVMYKSLEDFYRLKNDIFEALIPAFFILALAIVLFNSLLSGSLFKPFNKILTQMRTYKVGTGALNKSVNTSTTEFRKMQQLFHEMVERIEHDYRNLKEYTENMAHEMQTPLTVIRNKTENLIADEALMQKHSSTVKIIYDETNHLSKLGNTLNLITKIENHEFNNAVQIPTRPVIEKHLEAISEVAKLKSLAIEKELSQKHTLFIDPFLLDIILKNILRNAVRYGSDEGPIKVKTTVDTLSVSNYGPPLEVSSDKLFERFYRKNGTPSSQGLGLSLVKKICELNNLNISYNYGNKQHIFTITNKV